MIEAFVEAQELKDAVHIECGCKMMKELQFEDAVQQFLSVAGIDSTQILLVFPDLAQPFLDQIIPLRTPWQINTDLKDIGIYVTEVAQTQSKGGFATHLHEH